MCFPVIVMGHEADDDEDDEDEEDEDEDVAEPLAWRAAGASGAPACAAPPDREAPRIIQGCARATAAVDRVEGSTLRRPRSRVCRSALKESHATPGPKTTRPARFTRTV